MKSTYLAEQTAISKAVEYMFPPNVRLYEDPYSIEFVTAFTKFYIRLMKSKRFFKMMTGFMERVTPGVYGGIVCRSKYMDDAVLKAIEDGFDAVVNLGGGYDTRCLRLKGMERIEYYHIDLPEVVDAFRAVMSGLPAGLSSNMHFVPIDFNQQSLEEVLMKAGFDKTKRTLFIWEGVTQYISEEALSRTFEYISSTCTGSRVVFTYVLESYLANPEMFPKHKNIIKLIEKSGVRWINGLSPETMHVYLKAKGFNLIEDAGAPEYQERYLAPLGRVMDVMPIERVSLAEVI